MKTKHYMVLFWAFAFACLARPADAADRMRPGQWVGTTTVKTRTFDNANCVTPNDAAAMNGDAKSIQAFLEKTIPPEICKIMDIKVNGGQVIYTSRCKVGAPNVITTNYHGDHSESTSSDGTTSQAKLVGACK